MSDKVLSYAQQVADDLHDAGIRVILNKKADKIGTKIRQAEISKINVMLIVGAREVESGTVSVRRRFQGDTGTVQVDILRSDLEGEIKNRSMTHKQETDAEA